MDHQRIPEIGTAVCWVEVVGVYHLLSFRHTAFKQTCSQSRNGKSNQITLIRLEIILNKSLKLHPPTHLKTFYPNPKKGTPQKSNHFAPQPPTQSARVSIPKQNAKIPGLSSGRIDAIIVDESHTKPHRQGITQKIHQHPKGPLGYVKTQEATWVFPKIVVPNNHWFSY